MYYIFVGNDHRCRQGVRWELPAPGEEGEWRRPMTESGNGYCVARDRPWDIASMADSGAIACEVEVGDVLANTQLFCFVDRARILRVLPGWSEYNARRSAMDIALHVALPIWRGYNRDCDVLEREILLARRVVDEMERTARDVYDIPAEARAIYRAVSDAMRRAPLSIAFSRRNETEWFDIRMAKKIVGHALDFDRDHLFALHMTTFVACTVDLGLEQSGRIIRRYMHGERT